MGAEMKSKRFHDRHAQVREGGVARALRTLLKRGRQDLNQAFDWYTTFLLFFSTIVF